MFETLETRSMMSAAPVLPPHGYILFNDGNGTYGYYVYDDGNFGKTTVKCGNQGQHLTVRHWYDPNADPNAAKDWQGTGSTQIVNDDTGAVLFDTNTPHDEIPFYSSQNGSLEIDGGNGSDIVTLIGDHDTTGNTMGWLFAGGIQIHGMNGNDTLKIDGYVLGNVTFYGENGSDVMSVNCEDIFETDYVFVGGSGNDTAIGNVDTFYQGDQPIVLP